MAELCAVIVLHIRKIVSEGSFYSYYSNVVMDRILKGIMNYRKCHREGMVKQFKQVKDHPEVCSYDRKKTRVMIFSIDRYIDTFALPRRV